MTKEVFFFLLKTAIDGRKGFSIKYTGIDTIRLYSDTDIFTACFIGDVQQWVGNCFNGITVDANGRPYILFNF